MLGKLEVAPIEDKTRQRLVLDGLVVYKRGHIDATVRKTDSLGVKGTYWKTYKKTWIETVRNNLKALNFN